MADNPIQIKKVSQLPELFLDNDENNEIYSYYLDTSGINKITSIDDSYVFVSYPSDTNEPHNYKLNLKRLINNISKIVIIANKNLTIENSHKLCDKIEHRLSETIGNTEVSIHLEPNYEQVIA